MALTSTQKLAIKSHLGLAPNSDVLDNVFDAIDDVAEQLTELTTLLTSLDSAKTAWFTAIDNADEITSGEGATLDHNRAIKIKRDKYARLLGELSRITQWPVNNYLLNSAGYGNSNGTTGWQAGGL